ncbi:type II secretion system protein M [Achromobacter xylosoxidans]|uniref:type II secretion system protein GspM n=1 Tax=Alcaligenes xylosoxydans xylosoxydans TaxID=85698 RepID=UPI00122F9D9E|nr:type II secretion system protein GspM [Achromobacter xylosoxidans]QEQ22933.1 type II secretion system protein M [Achromobacter xylosoxidans]
MKPIERLSAGWRAAVLPLAPAARRARQRYQALAPRERLLVNGAAALLGAALVFTVLIEPALDSVRKLRDELPRLRGQAAMVADLTTQAATLRGKRTGPAATLPTAADIGASLERAGLPADHWKVAQPGPGDRITVAVTEIPSSALLRWLENTVGDWGLMVKTVALTRATNANGRPLPGLVNGSVTLALPGPQARS